MTELIKDILIRRDGNHPDEAQERIDIAKEELQEHLANGDTHLAEEICADHFGLEPDYLMELI